jgi:hypothetical protein
MEIGMVEREHGDENGASLGDRPCSHRRNWINYAVLCLSVLVIAALSTRAILPARMSAPERIERDGLQAAKKMMLLRSGKRHPSLLVDALRGKATEAHYMGVYRESLTKLLSMGYLEKRTFRFQNYTASCRSFGSAIAGRFTGEFYECEFRTPESSVVVVARPSRMEAWGTLVAEYDKPSGP